MKIGIAGYGFVGQAHANGLKDYYDILISDPAKEHYADLKHADAIIICVSTPQADDGKCFINNVYEVIASAPDVPIIIKSTISLEGWKYLKEVFPNKSLTFSPEFLRAKTALEDFKNSGTVLMGGDGTAFWSDVFINALGKLDIHICPPEELILVKYFRNTYLATKVSFFNQVFDMCEATGLDFNKVRRLIADDERITHSHTKVNADRGFGGHCFPKDAQALLASAKDNGVDLSILQEAINYNNKLRKDKT